MKSCPGPPPPPPRVRLRPPPMGAATHLSVWGGLAKLVSRLCPDSSAASRRAPAPPRPPARPGAAPPRHAAAAPRGSAAWLCPAHQNLAAGRPFPPSGARHPPPPRAAGQCPAEAATRRPSLGSALRSRTHAQWSPAWGGDAPPGAPLAPGAAPCGAQTPGLPSMHVGAATRPWSPRRPWGPRRTPLRCQSAGPPAAARAAVGARCGRWCAANRLLRP